MHSEDTVLWDDFGLTAAGEEGVVTNQVHSQRNTEAKIQSDLELSQIYTPLSVAKEEIWHRWNDKKLRQEVEKFLNYDVPEIFKGSPHAMLTRQVMSPNFELERFVTMAKLAELEPLHLEYSHDKFSARNIDKYYVSKLYFHYGSDTHNLCTVKTLKVIDFNHVEGNRLCDISTLHGERLIDFHHRFVDMAGFPNIQRFDVSDIFKRVGGTADKYYMNFFSWFLCYGILIENYLVDKNNPEFIEKIVLPNYKKVVNTFGIKPLIVHLGPDGDEENLYWRYYPLSLLEKVTK